MRIRKSMPPTAVPVSASGFFRGLAAAVPGSGTRKRVEEEIGDRFGGRHPFFLSSGKAALCLLLAALKGLRRRTKVIIPGYTCFSVPSAVRKAGLKIVLCDVRSDSLDFDHQQLETLADEDTLCIVPTHLFGIRADVERVRKIADRKGIFVIEDSAQAFRLPVETAKDARGDAEFFSLGRGKNITCGSGGILLSGSEEITNALRRTYDGLETESASIAARSLIGLAMMGMFVNPYLYWIPDGLPFLGIGKTIYSEEYQILKMNNVKYGIMVSWKRDLHLIGERRTHAGERYKEALGVDKRCSIYSTALPYLRFPVYMKDEETKARVCREYRHLGISAMYPSSIGEVEEISSSVSVESSPNSQRISKTLVTLPTHHLVDDQLIGKIRCAIGDCLDRDCGGKLHG